MIVANGLPKSGTHALMAWFSRMGLKRCPGVIAPDDSGSLTIHGAGNLCLETLSAVPHNSFIQGHIPANIHLDDFMVVTIFRDPRDVLVSYVRHRARWGGLEITIAQAIADFWGEPFVPTYASYLGWKGRCIAVRYKDLAPEHIGDGADIYDPERPEWDRWIGNTRTGSPSDWREHWNGETEEAWQAAGGVELVERAGYGSHVWLPSAELAA